MLFTHTYSILLPETGLAKEPAAFSFFLTIAYRRAQFHRINDANKAVHNPKQAITLKDTRRLAACAMKPIRGGPNKKPKKPIVDTAASATPGNMVLDLPAELYTSGTTDDTPIPTNKKPAVAGITVGNKTAVNNPTAMTNPLHCSMRFAPSRAVSRSPIKRPPAIVLIKAT